ncbi:MAG: hypothetical protein WKF37_05290 [Bryobacteraceae bacterium]
MPRLTGWHAQVIQGESVIGGGSTPDRVLPTWLVAIRGGLPNKLEAELRRGYPAVIARINDDRVVIDLRTVLESEEEELVEALQARSR